MYNDDVSEAPLYLVPNAEGTGKRLVRRPHPPPTTAPLPDDFDAITETRDSTTIYDDATNSALGIDYDDITTIAPAPAAAAAAAAAPSYGRASAPPIHAPVPISPPRNLTSPLRQHRPSSPSHSFAGLSPDVRGPRRSAGAGGAGDGMSVGKARSVVGDRDRERTAQRRSLGTGNAPVPMPMPSGKGPAKGRNELVEKLVIEDGPERTISLWREHIAKNGTGAAHGEENGGGGGGGDGDGRSDLDNHVGRRRVSTDSRRRVESLVQSTTGSPGVKGKGHRKRESAEFTEDSRSPLPLQAGLPMRSSTPLASGPSQPTTPQKSQQQRRAAAAAVAPTSPSVGPKGTEYSASVSDVSTKVASHNNQVESVLSSCQPSLLHLLPILEELGVRRSEHMTALARMRDETRDREVKEEALRKGITVVEWAILIDKLQSL